MKERNKIKYDLEEIINMPLGYKITNLSGGNLQGKDEVYSDNMVFGEEYIITAIHIYGKDENGNEVYDSRIIGLDESKCYIPIEIEDIKYEIFGEKGTFSYKNFDQFDITNTYFSDEEIYENPTAYERFLETIPKEGISKLPTSKLIDYFKNEIYQLENPQLFEEYEEDEEKELSPEEEEMEDVKYELLAKMEYDEMNLYKSIEEELKNPRTNFEFVKYHQMKQIEEKDAKEYEEFNKKENEKELLKKNSIDKIINQNSDEETYQPNTKQLIETYSKTIDFLKYMNDTLEANTYEKIIKDLMWGLVDESVMNYLIEETYLQFPDFLEATKVGYPEYLNIE